MPIEEELYPVLMRWLSNEKKCDYVDENKNLWGKQPDVVGIRLVGNESLAKLYLYLVEAKVANNLSSVYELIGEIEVKIALCMDKTSIFYALYPYIAVFKDSFFNDFRLYCKNRNVGLIKMMDGKGIYLSIVRNPNPIVLGKTVSVEQIKDTTKIRNAEERKILDKIIEIIGWWKLKELMSIKDIDR